ncbi:MAG: response regulator transcription factor [Methylococcales bacterium]|nr:response regulator transcription factor [Methylococcales bacterium]
MINAYSVYPELARWEAQVPVTNPISVVIVDGNEAVRKGIHAYFESLTEFKVVGEAVSGEETLTLVSEFIPDIVLMDLILPDMDGIEIIHLLKQVSPCTQIVVLTSSDGDAYILPALKAGAISIILKEIKMNKLADILRRIVGGEVALHPRLVTHILDNTKGDGNQTLYSEFTEYEINMLMLIAGGLSNRQAAEKLDISEDMFQRNVSNILIKLHFTWAVQKKIEKWIKNSALE